MQIAVASRDGKCADWIVFDVTLADEGDAEPEVIERERITVPKELVFHHFKDGGPHPLGECQAVIGASAGDSFVNKMRRRGIEAVLTAEPDPAKAVADYVHNTLLPAKPRPIGGLICKIRDAFSSDG